MSGAESFWRAVDSIPAPFGTVLQSVKQRMLRETGVTELFLVIESLESEGIPYWLAGGWGVDRAPRETDPPPQGHRCGHRRFRTDEPKARQALLALGFNHVNFDEGGMWMPTVANFGDDAGHRIEVLGIDWEHVGSGLNFVPGPGSKSYHEECAGEVFTMGTMDGRKRVPCSFVQKHNCCSTQASHSNLRAASTSRSFAPSSERPTSRRRPRP